MRIKLLIQYGADLFAASNLYGTPTDLARCTGNFDIWRESLSECGLGSKRILAMDKRIKRRKRFAALEELVHDQTVERNETKRQFENMFMFW